MQKGGNFVQFERAKEIPTNDGWRSANANANANASAYTH